MLRTLGHRVDIAQRFKQQKADIMLALHAWRSADSIASFADRFQDKPLLVALTGTDIYRFMHTHRETTIHSIQLAHRLIGLHAKIANVLPENQHRKLVIIYQSASSLTHRHPVKRSFRVCVAGHLRNEKDPLRPAFAVRSLPHNSRIQVQQYGKAHNPAWAGQAENEMRTNSRYHWYGEVPHFKLRKAYSSSHLLVLPSRLEGGANVISEAVMAGLPVIASRIDGSIGLLGEDYPGYFSVGQTTELRDCLLRAESDIKYYRHLQNACMNRQHLFTPQRELQSWKSLLSAL
jgi:putative glycosyltransferase (TIGR04348 family)